LRFILPPGVPAFFHESNRAGRAEFTIQVRIAAAAAGGAQVHIVLHTLEVRLDIRMVYAFSHCFASGFRTKVLSGGFHPQAIWLHGDKAMKTV